MAWYIKGTRNFISQKDAPKIIKEIMKDGLHEKIIFRSWENSSDKNLGCLVFLSSKPIQPGQSEYKEN